MRSVSIACLVGLCVSVVACSVSTAPSASEEETTSPADGSDPALPRTNSAHSDDGANAPGVAGEAVEDLAGDDADAGSAAPAPPTDGGANANADASDAGKPKVTIPVPKFGYLHAATKTGETCAFTVDGVARGTSSVLDLGLVVGTHSVACKRADGTIASETFAITEKQTTNVELAFVSNGTLVAVAVNGTCAFSVNGAAKGTGSTIKLSLDPGAYHVTCKPTVGLTKSRDVVIKSGETAMVMFKL